MLSANTFRKDRKKHEKECTHRNETRKRAETMSPFVRPMKRSRWKKRVAGCPRPHGTVVAGTRREPSSPNTAESCHQALLLAAESQSVPISMDDKPAAWLKTRETRWRLIRSLFLLKSSFLDPEKFPRDGPETTGRRW